MARENYSLDVSIDASMKITFHKGIDFNQIQVLWLILESKNNIQEKTYISLLKTVVWAFLYVLISKEK